jgi:hypothetical protein
MTPAFGKAVPKTVKSAARDFQGSYQPEVVGAQVALKLRPCFRHTIPQNLTVLMFPDLPLVSRWDGSDGKYR